jgi:hypothetical protein
MLAEASFGLCLFGVALVLGWVFKRFTQFMQSESDPLQEVEPLLTKEKTLSFEEIEFSNELTLFINGQKVNHVAQPAFCVLGRTCHT